METMSTNFSFTITLIAQASATSLIPSHNQKITTIPLTGHHRISYTLSVHLLNLNLLKTEILQSLGLQLSNRVSLKKMSKQLNIITFLKLYGLEKMKTA